MITPTKINEIEKYNNSDFEILSVCLSEDSLQAPTRPFLMTQFHSLIHQLTEDQRQKFQDYINRIEDYLNDYTPSARSLVFFTAGDDLWEVVDFEFAMTPNIVIEKSPNLKPIKKALQEYSKYLVLLVDREKARMFTVAQGEIMDHSDFVGGYVPQKKKMTGRDGNAGRGDIDDRHTEDLLRRHINLISDAVSKFVKANDISFLILGGHNEMFRKVANSLSPDLQAKIAGSFVSELNIPLNDILLESKKIAAIIN